MLPKEWRQNPSATWQWNFVRSNLSLKYAMHSGLAKIRTSINGKSNDGCSEGSTNINGKSHKTRTRARVSMATQVNQHTHRKMRTRCTTNISGNSNDASKMNDLRMTIGTNIFRDTHPRVDLNFLHEISRPRLLK